MLIVEAFKPSTVDISRVTVAPSSDGRLSIYIYFIRLNIITSFHCSHVVGLRLITTLLMIMMI